MIGVLAILVCITQVLCSRRGCTQHRLTQLDQLKERRYTEMVDKRQSLTDEFVDSLYANSGHGAWYIVQPDYSCADVILVGHHFYDGGKYICNLHKLQTHHPTRECLYYSFGVNGEIEFERELVKLLPDCEMHAFDPTPSVVGGPSAQELPELGVTFHPWGLSDVDGTINLEETAVDAFKLSTIQQRLGHADSVIDILKIDIEGFEWRVFEQLLATCDRDYPVAHQILMELHLFSAHQFLTKLSGFMDSMRSCGYRCFVKDPNHFCPSCMEYGFVHEQYLKCK